MQRSGSAFALHVKGPGFDPRHLQGRVFFRENGKSSESSVAFCRPFFPLFDLLLAKVLFLLCVLQFQNTDQPLPRNPLRQSKKSPNRLQKIFYLKLDKTFWPRGPNHGLLQELTCKRYRIQFNPNSCIFLNLIQINPCEHAENYLMINFSTFRKIQYVLHNDVF